MYLQSFVRGCERLCSAALLHSMHAVLPACLSPPLLWVPPGFLLNNVSHKVGGESPPAPGAATRSLFFVLL